MIGSIPKWSNPEAAVDGSSREGFVGKTAPGETTQAEWLLVGAGHCQGSPSLDFVSAENGPSWRILNHSVVEQKLPNIILLNSNT